MLYCNIYYTTLTISAKYSAIEAALHCFIDQINLQHFANTHASSFSIVDFIFRSKFKSSLRCFGQNLCRAVTALGAAWGEKVAVGSSLGTEAGNWQQVLLFLSGLRLLHYKSSTCSASH